MAKQKQQDQPEQDQQQATGESDRPLRLEYWSRKQLRGTLNPNNWRTHEAYQLDAIRESINRNSYAKGCIYNAHTGRLINGHGRVMTDGPDDEQMPVLIGSWSQEDEEYLLATMDPIGAMATANYEKLQALLPEVTQKMGDEAAGMMAVLEKHAERYAIQLSEEAETVLEQAGDQPHIEEMLTGEVQQSPTQMIQLFFDQAKALQFTTAVATLRERWQQPDASTAGILLEAARRVKAANS